MCWWTFIYLLSPSVSFLFFLFIYFEWEVWLLYTSDNIFTLLLLLGAGSTDQGTNYEEQWRRELVEISSFSCSALFKWCPHILRSKALTVGAPVPVSILGAPCALPIRPTLPPHVDIWGGSGYKVKIHPQSRRLTSDQLKPSKICNQLLLHWVSSLVKDLSGTHKSPWKASRNGETQQSKVFTPAFHLSELSVTLLENK